MTLNHLIRGKLILPGLLAQDRPGAIRELVAFMILEGELEAQHGETVVQAALRRERTRPTGTQLGIALPHGVTDVVPDEMAAIGISRDGIPFLGLDGQPARIVILLLTPTLKALTRVRTLAKIAGFVNCPDRRAALVAATDRATAVELIRSVDLLG